MPSVSTLTGAFRDMQATLRNARWSWSAISDDGTTVVVTVWDDQIGPDGSVNTFGDPDRHIWENKLGNRYRARDLAYAQKHCDGRFRVVRVTAADLDADPRVIVQRTPEHDLWMKVERLDEQTGEYFARRIA